MILFVRIKMAFLKTIFTSLFSVIFLSASGAFADIKTAQTYLKQMGYNAGTIDGLWGKKTEEALELFLRDQNAKVGWNIRSKRISND